MSARSSPHSKQGAVQDKTNRIRERTGRISTGRQQSINRFGCSRSSRFPQKFLNSYQSIPFTERKTKNAKSDGTTEAVPPMISGTGHWRASLLERSLRKAIQPTDWLFPGNAAQPWASPCRIDRLWKPIERRSSSAFSRSDGLPFVQILALLIF